MSKKQKKFFDIAKIGRNLKNKTSKFVQNKILSNSKSLLLIGGDSNPFFKNKLIDKYKNTWKIANISNFSANCDYNITIPKFDKSTLENVEQQVKKFSRYCQCIILMPQLIQSYTSISDERFLDQFYSEKPNKVELGLTAFRLASKFLTTTGIVILSSAQKPFMAQKNLNTTKNIIQNQINYLNILIGQRDYTDIDSFALSALVQQINLKEQNEDLNKIIQIYKNWSDGYRLPMPGSYAKIIKKQNLMYPQYY